MNDKHHDSLKRYVNDVIGLESDIANAVAGQLADDRLDHHPGLADMLHEIVLGSEARIARLRSLSGEEGGKLGAAVKEAATTVTGILAGIYGRIREHPVSRMVRDDIIAMDVAATSYGMLRTLALAVGHEETGAIALEGLRAAPPRVLKLTDLLPGIVAAELAREAPLVNPDAARLANAEIRAAWNQPDSPHPDRS